MQYSVQSINLSKLPLSPKGVIKPLCNTCCNQSCSNNIIWTNISFFGKTERCRVLKKGNHIHFVVSCPEGFIECGEDNQDEETKNDDI
ncbi:MAG: hypothetical protein ACOC5T_06835 [Elusimicrobiota bacterium]